MPLVGKSSRHLKVNTILASVSITSAPSAVFAQSYLNWTEQPNTTVGHIDGVGITRYRHRPPGGAEQVVNLTGMPPVLFAGNVTQVDYLVLNGGGICGAVCDYEFWA